MKVVRREAAQTDVDAIWAYHAEIDVNLADRIVDRIAHATDRLFLFAHSGRRASMWDRVFAAWLRRLTLYIMRWKRIGSRS